MADPLIHNELKWFAVYTHSRAEKKSVGTCFERWFCRFLTFNYYNEAMELPQEKNGSAID